MESKLIRSLPVITLQTGKMLGKVQEVAVDVENKKVNALVVGEKVFLKTKSAAVFFDQLRSIGQDAITVGSEEEAIKLTNTPELEKQLENSLLEQQVISEEGKLVGTVEDFTFDPATGKLQALVIKGGTAASFPGGRGYLPLNNIMNFGRDFIISTSSSIKNIEALPENIKEDSRAETKAGEAVKYPTETWSSSLEDKARVLGRSLEVRTIEHALGKEAGYTVSTASGKTLVNKGDIITQEIIDEARANHRLYQLLFSAGVSEILEGIDYTAGKFDEGSRKLIEAWQAYKNRGEIPEKETYPYGEKGKQTEPAINREERRENYQDTTASIKELENRLEDRWHEMDQKINRLAHKMENLLEHKNM